MVQKGNRQKDKGTVFSGHLSPWCWRSWARPTEKWLRWRLKNDGGQQWVGEGDKSLVLVFHPALLNSGSRCSSQESKYDTRGKADDLLVQ